MKKITLNLIISLSIGVFFFTFVAFIDNHSSNDGGCSTNNRFTGGVGAGYTGSPGDGVSCYACHDMSGAQEIPVTGWLSSDIPATGYVPGNTYNFTVTNNGGSVLGFQTTCEDASNNGQGSFNPSGSGVNNPSSNTLYVGHSSKTLTTKTFEWTAPVSGTGSVTFYSTIINGDNGGGKKTNNYLDQLSYEESSLGLTNVEGNHLVNIFPNPNNGHFVIKIISNNSDNYTIDVVSIQGKKILSKVANNITNIQVDLSSFSKGVYFVKIQNSNNSQVERIVVE